MSEKSTRRQFLTKSTAAAVSVGLASQLALPKGAFAANGDETIRVGLIGCGGRGTGAAAQALSTEGDVKLVALADAFEDHLSGTLKRLQNQKKDRVAVDEDHQFVGLDAYKKLIDSDVDLVILATPPGFRPVHFAYAVAKGKHVFMEKPVATDARGVRTVLAAVEEAKKKGLKVGVGLQRHHQNTYLAALEQVREGAIGDIIAARVYWNSAGVWEPRRTREQVSGEMEYQLRNWYYYNWLCGDHINEQHIHNIDVGCWFKDAYPVKAYGMGGREVRDAPRYGNIFDHFAVEYEWADGSRMFSQCRHIPNTWNSVSEHLHGTKGQITLSGTPSYKNADGNEWRYRGPKNDPYQTEHDELFAAIREGKPYNEGDYGAYSTMAAIMGRMATYSGKPIEWDKALGEGRDVYPWDQELTWDSKPPVLPGPDGEYPQPIPGITEVV